MAHSFEDLVEMQRAADQAHATVEQLLAEYGPPTKSEWTDQQTSTYESAWKAWRDLATDVQAAVTEHATDEGRPRHEIEADVKKATRHAKTPQP